MIELDHSINRYQGAPGEQVTITITPHDTTALVAFVLDGVPAQPLPPGVPLRFNLKNTSGAVTRLQLLMDFNGEGSYDIKVENVVNCPDDPQHTSCTHSRIGPPLIIENHQYSVA